MADEVVEREGVAAGEDVDREVRVQEELHHRQVPCTHVITHVITHIHTERQGDRGGGGGRIR